MSNEWQRLVSCSQWIKYFFYKQLFLNPFKYSLIKSWIIYHLIYSKLNTWLVCVRIYNHFFDKLKDFTFVASGQREPILNGKSGKVYSDLGKSRSSLIALISSKDVGLLVYCELSVNSKKENWPRNKSKRKLFFLSNIY